ncbi:hypothetical protein ACVIM9_008307 [Bradyrhizobium sp. USDA 4520]
MGEAEKLLDQVNADACCEPRSRELQNVIAERRATNPLAFPLIYWLNRPEMEERMKAGISSNLATEKD